MDVFSRSSTEVSNNTFYTETAAGTTGTVKGSNESVFSSGVFHAVSEVPVFKSSQRASSLTATKPGYHGSAWQCPRREGGCRGSICNRPVEGFLSDGGMGGRHRGIFPPVKISASGRFRGRWIGGSNGSRRVWPTRRERPFWKRRRGSGGRPAGTRWMGRSRVSERSGFFSPG